MQRSRTGWMRRAKLLAIILALGVGAACGDGDACGLGPMADTTGWQVVDAGDFVFKLPPGYRDEMPRGIDSYVGRWKRGERWVGFDYGQHTSDPRGRNRSNPDERLCRERIGGRTAILRRPPVSPAAPRRYGLDAWWRSTNSKDERVAHLSMHAGAPWNDAEGRSVAATVLRTVRFRTRWTAQDRLRQRHYGCARLRAEAARTPHPHPPSFAEELRACPTGPPPPPPDYESVR